MTDTAKWDNAKLFDLQGKEFRTVRVPCNPLPPGVIMWGNRYFYQTFRRNIYMETQSYLVPLESMYPPDAPVPGPAEGKAKK
jgi:hypothetical protein